MIASPSVLGSLFMLFSVLLTETVVSTIGNYLLTFTRLPGTYPTPAEFEAIGNFAHAISVLSPQHMGARILGDLFGIMSMWPDVHVVVPVAILVLAAGYMMGKTLYLDIFVR